MTTTHQEVASFLEAAECCRRAEVRSKLTKPKTGAQARADFDHKGLSIAKWAREHGFSRSLVYEVLAGRKKCMRGDSHKIAVMLGMKHGEIVQ